MGPVVGELSIKRLVLSSANLSAISSVCAEGRWMKKKRRNRIESWGCSHFVCRPKVLATAIIGQIHNTCILFILFDGIRL